MSGYTKRMMDVAAEWLKANPDPLSPFVNVPTLDKNSVVRTPDKLDYYKRAAKQIPSLKPLVDKMQALVQEHEETLDNLHEQETRLEDLLGKAPESGHTKYSTDEKHHADTGRWCLTWARQGYNVFELSPDFTAAILLTDARELDISDVQLPFAGMLIMIPDGFAVGAEGSSYTKIHVMEMPRNDRTMLGAADKIFSALKELPVTEASALLADLRDKPAAKQSLIAIDPSDTMIHIHASDGVRVLETWIERKDLTWDAFDNLPDDVTEDADKQARHALRQIVFGAIAYANAVEGSVEERFEGPRKPKGTAKLRAKQWTIGRTIKIDPQLVRAVRGGSREVSFRLKHRHIVRGHYRNQAHGPARSLRTKKWISPHWKGPEEGAALVHTYKLEES